MSDWDKLDDHSKAYVMALLLFSITGILGVLIGWLYIWLTGNYPVDPELLLVHIKNFYINIRGI